MRNLHRSPIALLAAAGLGLVATPGAQAQPRTKPGAAATRADVDRLDKKIDEQQRRIDKLIALQLQYMQLLAALSDASTSPAAAPDPRTTEPGDSAKPAEGKLAAASEPRKPITAIQPNTRPVVAAEPRVNKPKVDVVGNVVGKVTGATDAVVYVEDLVVSTRGSAEMKQENKQFSPQVLVVQKGTTVQFPNKDAIFHNVFSVSPDNSFDLGNYRQGESKGVTMSKPGVVSVYCNMHPQMVGHILVVPNGNFTRAGKDGFFRLSNVPVGRHRIVAWAPNAKPVAADAEVSEAEPVTVELELKKLRRAPHLKKDGMPYGSYEK